VRCELFLRIDEMKVARAGLVRLLGEMRSLFSLADIDGHGDDFAAVVLFQPGDDDRGIESARVGECNLFHAAFSLLGVGQAPSPVCVVGQPRAAVLHSASMNSVNAFFGTM